MKREAAVLLSLAMLHLVFSVTAAHAASHPNYAGFAQPIASYAMDSRDIQFSSGTDSKTVPVSVSDYAVYRYAYVSTDGQPWQQIPLSGNALGGQWLNGSVSGQLSFTAANFSLSAPGSLSKRNFIVVYTCTRNGDAWECHSGWQIYNFTARLASSQADVRIVSVSASGDDGHVPANTLDGNLSIESRWSAEGDGQWVMYGLSEEAYVDEVRIAFYKGNERTTTLSVELSQDGSSWSRMLDHKVSGGGSLAYETFSFAGGQARYVRIVGHGNSAAGSVGWNSYTEVRIEDFAIDLPCIPESYASTCARGCGQQTGNCGQTVACSACPTCSDGVKNGDETGVDCGGAYCAACSSPPGGSCDGRVVLYQNNFEHRATGGYTLSEFMTDWNATGGGDRWDKAMVVSDSGGNPSKALAMYYPFYNSDDFRWICWSDDRCSASNGGRLEFTSEPSFGSSSLLDGVGPGSGGGQWWVRIPGGTEAGGYRELYLSYRVRFGDGFFAVDGGKLPGFCGGTCPGGGKTTDSNGDGSSDGFSARMMFEYNDIRFYVYHPTRGTTYGSSQLYENLPISSIYDGQWHTVVHRIVMNDRNSENGIIEGWFDGVLKTSERMYMFRNGSTTNFAIDTILFSTFYGGDSRRCPDDKVSSGDRGCSRYKDNTNYLWYAPRKDEVIYFDDLVVYYYSPSVSVTRGNTLSPADRVELPPPVGNRASPLCS